MKIIHEAQINVEESIICCQELNHIQQVAYSTYHHALTQICFTCGEIHTSLKEKDLKETSQKFPEEKRNG